MLTKLYASELRMLIYNNKRVLLAEQLIKTMIEFSAPDKKKAVSLFLAECRQDFLTNDLLAELLDAVKEMNIQEQLIAFWVLMAKSDQPLVAKALTARKLKFIQWPTLANRVIYDNQGERYLLRLSLGNAFFPTIYIDVLDRDVDFSKERWPLDLEIAEPLRYDGFLNKTTVGRFSFSFIEQHLDEVYSLEKNRERVPLKKLNSFFSSVELSRSEFIFPGRGRGLYKQLAEGLNEIIPRGGLLSLKEIIEEDTVKKLKDGCPFSETLFGKSFTKKNFKEVGREYSRANRYTGDESIDILLEKR